MTTRLHLCSLPALRELECLRLEGGHQRSLVLDNPTLVGDREFSLETRGIFCVAHKSRTCDTEGWASFYREGRCPNGSFYVWGLTIAGVWVLARITFRGEPGYKDRGYERAHEVHIVRSDIPTIVATANETYTRIWDALRKTAERGTQVQKNSYDLMRATALEMELEDEILKLALVAEE